MKQRDKMNELVARHKGDEKSVVIAYAEAEQKGEVSRKNNSHNWDSISYAKALMRDGKRKNWIK
jgi:hypothetical protein